MRDPRLIEYARENRRELTLPERKLWYQLRAKRFEGIKFRRQHVLGRYIADFYSRRAKLVIEIDGDSHAFQEEYDKVREKYMNKLGLKVMRFTNSEVMQNMDGVLVMIGEAVAATPPLPTLPPEGERAR